MSQGKVYVNGAESRILREEESGKLTFSYNDDYRGRPVCLTMPLRNEEYESDYLFPFFSEGTNRNLQSQLLHIDENDVLEGYDKEYLEAIC